MSIQSLIFIYYQPSDERDGLALSERTTPTVLVESASVYTTNVTNRLQHGHDDAGTEFVA